MHVGVGIFAEQLGMSRNKLYELMYKGELASVEIPGKSEKTHGRRIEQAEIDAFVERHRVTGGVTTFGAF